MQQTGSTYTLTGDLDGSIVVNRNNVSLDGNEYSISGGLSLNEISNITVKNFVIRGGEVLLGAGLGISLNDIGISLNGASNVIVTNNTISGFWSIQELNGLALFGVAVKGGGSNIITENTLVNNNIGLYFSDSQNNLIIGNNIIDNASQYGLSSCGIIFSYASNNTVYHNNFMDNITYGVQASDGTFYGFGSPNSINVWDDGYPNGGNYWIDYQRGYPNAAEIDSSGIGNTSYVIDSQNRDRYPLMDPFNTTPPKISVL
jgi:parallel beta-helix repeat protein